MSENLTKKQQKALAFRAKQKAKKRGVEEPEDVPEADLDLGGDDDAPEPAPAEAPVAGKSAKGDKAGAGDGSKKRKREGGDSEDAESGAANEDDPSAEPKKDKGKAKKAKAKAKTAWDEDDEEDDEDGKKKTKKDIKQRYILFIGNLGYKSTRQDVEKHFSEAAGRTPSVRLLTEKAAPGSKTPPKSRGIAFVELATGAEMQACLRLHHTILNQRRINVELTAGGGGRSAARRGKIAERNTRVGGQRERRAEKEAEEAAKNGTALPDAPGAPESAAQDDAPDGFKMRNGRRVKVKAGDHAAKRPRTDGGWAGRAGGGGAPPPSRKRWEPTGANAVSVGK